MYLYTDWREILAEIGKKRFVLVGTLCSKQKMCISLLNIDLYLILLHKLIKLSSSTPSNYKMSFGVLVDIGNSSQ